MQISALVSIAAPVILLTLLGVSTLVGRPFPENVVGRLVQSAVTLGLVASLVILALMLATGDRLVPIRVGEWVHIPGYHFQIKFEFDRLSVPFVILTFLLCGTIAAFANRYLHRERGFHRFFVAFALFTLGMVLTSLAGSIETLFAGWELVGLSSALLVAFFHDRPAPVRNGLHVWTVYRVSDAALLIGSILLHHWAHGGDFQVLLGLSDTVSWPQGALPHDMTPDKIVIVGLLFILAAAGKSALAPFCNWLPRAMEGPTPSSAIFYGALSVHLGAFLLLRLSPIISASLTLQVVLVVLGLVTALYAALAGRVQTDIKCALSYASLTQVGIIVAEIGFGLRYIALIHLLGHACFRTLQFLRAPSILRDVRAMEDALGRRLPGLTDLIWASVSPQTRAWFYRLALERGYMDAFLIDYLVRPVLGVFRFCDGLERRWTDFLAGGQSRESDRLESSRAVDDLS